jgi:hypothetical protein
VIDVQEVSMRRIGTALLLVLAACGSSGGGGDDTTDDPTPDANEIPEGFVELIGRDWTMEPGERYKCIGIVAEEDMIISTFRTPNPSGEHHAVLTVADAPGGFGGTQLGEYDCGVNTLGLEMMFASGVGTDDLAFPEGVGIRVAAGQFLHLNLHLFNTQPSGDISGHSAILVKTIAEAELENEAEMVFAGTFDINIPPESEGTASGGCTFSNDQTLMAYWPHMHQYANHHKVTLTIDGVEQVLHDEEFSFEEQINYPLEPNIQVSAGDSINVECTYFNDHPTEALTFGDSSTQEMCFTGMYRYPKTAFSLFDCAQGG